MARCTIVIPVHDRVELTRRCLDVVLGQELGDAEVVVVDDGSTDGTQALLANYEDRVVVRTLVDNLGFAGACNAGAATSDSELIVFVNNDTVPPPGWLTAMIGYLDSHPDASIVGAKLLWPDNVVQHAGIVITACGWPHAVYRGFPSDHPAVNRSRRMRAVSAACMLVRRSAFQAVRGFDASFHNGYEDVDLCLRIAERGGETHYCHEAIVYHLESATRGSNGHGEATDPNLELLLDRWRGRLGADDLQTYVNDGVLELHYEGHPHPIGIKIDPCLASVAVAEADNTLQRLLNLRSRQVFELLRELGRDAPQPPDLTVQIPSVLFRADGARVAEQAVAEQDVSGVALRAVEILAGKTEPLRLRVTASEPERVNVLLPSLESDELSGQHVAIYQLTRRLRSIGALRVIALERPMVRDAESIRAQVNEIEGLAGALSGIELVDAADRSSELRVNPNDRFVATTGFTASVAHAAAVELGQPCFLHVIQEYDPVAFPAGAFQAVAGQGYAYPHLAVFSSTLLRDFFAERGIGVYAAGRDRGDQRSCTFEHAITDVGDIAAADLTIRPQRLLMHAQTQTAEARSMFELAVLSLRAAIDERAVPYELEFTGVGRSGTGRGAIPLAHGAWLEMIPRQSPGRYRALLRTHTVGLSLLHTPQPSRVALEMAAAGMPVVTTTYATKTAERMTALSENIIAVEPSVDSLVDALRQAMRRAQSPGLCADGARVAWSRSWEETFDPPVLENIERLLSGCRRDA